MVESTTINGYQYDHGDCTFKVRGKEYSGGVKEIKYTSKREIGSFRGASPRRRGRTRGTIDFEGSIVLWKYMFDLLVQDFGPGWMEEVFDIVVSYGQDDQPLTIDTLVEVTFNNVETGTSEGADPIEVSLGLDLMNILYGGTPTMKGMKLPP